jgi:hypothetical protein
MSIPLNKDTIKDLLAKAEENKKAGDWVDTPLFDTKTPSIEDVVRVIVNVPAPSKK